MIKKITLAATGLTDCTGEEIMEGDYLLQVKNFHEEEYYSKVGRVIWDYRRNCWQIVKMILPNVKVKPSSWGKCRADFFGDNSDDFKIVNDSFDYEYIDNFDGYWNKDGDWKIESYYSGGVEVPFHYKQDGATYEPR